MTDLRDPVDVSEAYAEAFGEAGDFDAWLLPSAVNTALMRRALRRHRPITKTDLDDAYTRLHGMPRPPAPPPGAVT